MALIRYSYDPPGTSAGSLSNSANPKARRHFGWASSTRTGSRARSSSASVLNWGISSRNGRVRPVTMAGTSFHSTASFPGSSTQTCTMDGSTVTATTASIRGARSRCSVWPETGPRTATTLLLQNAMTNDRVAATPIRTIRRS